jgi:hypothetical protein
VAIFTSKAPIFKGFSSQPHLIAGYLAGGDWNIFYDFPYIGNFIIPTVTHSMIFQDG